MKLLILTSIVFLTSCAGMSYKGDGYYTNNGDYVLYEKPPTYNFIKPLMNGKSGHTEIIDNKYVFVEDKERETLFDKLKNHDWTPLWMKRD